MFRPVGLALEILDAARALGDYPCRLVFPMRSRRLTAMSTLPKMLRRRCWRASIG